MLNLGDIVRVMEHPYSDATYYLGEVTHITDDAIHCLTLARVRGGRPVPIDPAREAFKTAPPTSDQAHDEYRARLGRSPRIRRMAQASNQPVWQPSPA